MLTEFSNAIRHYGLTPPDRLIADGKIHRFRSGPEKAENGFYSLKVLPAYKGGEIGYGLLGCWKRDIKEQWCSKEPGELTAPDRTAIERARAEMKQLDLEATRAAAEKARAIWGKASSPDPRHPYLIAKAIEPRGIRQHKDALVVPVYRGGAISSLQFISPDGTKRFLTDGQVEGGYASISAKESPKDRIVIAEGYATAASLHAATGLPCVVCFTAGNILSAAKAIRAKYPDAALTIAADNDRQTVVRGEPVNVGLVRARQAADAVGAGVTWPEFSAGDPAKFSDFNDYCSLHGLEATRAAFFAGLRPDASADAAPSAASASPPSQPDLPPEPPPHDVIPHESSPPRPSPTDWRARLIPGKEVGDGHPFPFDRKSKLNAYMFLKHHERFAGLLCYNEFTDAVMLVRTPPWEGEERFTPRAIRDDDFFMLAANLEYCDITAAKETVADAAIRVAKEHAINPPREYLARLAWDRKPRLDTWLTYYLGADEQPAEYLALVGSKWMIGAVSRVFEPGCKFDSVLILEGSQGLGKSMALRSLATFHGQDFFLDSVGDIRNKDTLMTMQGKLIVEIAELASFRKSENEEIKAFITRQVDEYRPPYGRTVLKRPRYFVLAGSTNEVEEGYLTDDTGNRRYWPVKCKAIDAASVERDADQLWAEAVARYRSGERSWLAAEEIFHSAREQKSRFMEDAWQDRIGEIVRHEWVIKIDDLLAKLELKPRDISNMTKKRVKNSLRQLGWYETRRAGEGRLWRKAEGGTASLFEG